MNTACRSETACPRRYPYAYEIKRNRCTLRLGNGGDSGQRGAGSWPAPALLPQGTGCRPLSHPEPRKPTEGTPNGASYPGADRQITARPARRNIAGYETISNFLSFRLVLTQQPAS